MTGAGPIRILIADDHPMIRDGIAGVISSEPDMRVIAQASNGREAIDAFHAHRPDVTLMDLQMPELDGVAAIAAICAEWKVARIVALTTYTGDVQAMRALKAGARGYVLKGMVRKELMDAIRAVHAGQLYIPAEIASELGLHSLRESLSARELEVLNELARGATNKEIGARLFVSEHTIKAHMKSILAKLDATDRTHALLIAVRRGIIDIWAR
jgi:DNA-binding NarL/FixJ family response regulator